MRDEREERIYKICETNTQFKPQAFFFVYMVLGRCRNILEKPGHVSGAELLKAFSEEARAQYGPMGLTVLNHMGFQSTEDVGRLVFLMVEEGLLSRTDNDSLEDFKNKYEFQEEFVTKYQW
jgi:uncharacterized repeat protein (TIGR04138 family)